MSQNYYISLVGAYVASYVCGISIEHLTPSDEIPKQITSFMRFHIYFTIRRITRELQDAVGEILGKGDPHRVSNPVRINRSANNEPRNRILQKYKANELQGHFPDFHGRIVDQTGDFKKFISKKSDGITSTGLILLNQSIEAYIYAILGSQSKTRQSIVGNRGSALETQVVFRQIVEDSIINYDTQTWIQNMNLAIFDTNVVLDIAISPRLGLLPSNMIIQKTTIPRYNNMLRVATKNMKFGLNKNINYYGSERSEHQPKKIHQDSAAITSHLDSIDSESEGTVRAHHKHNAKTKVLSISSERGDRAVTEGGNPFSSSSQSLQIVFV